MSNLTPYSRTTIQARSGQTVSPAQATTVGRADIGYTDQAENVSWKHWPAPVLNELRSRGEAPNALHAGTAGDLVNKRRPDGTHYQERAGWYLGGTAAGFEVFSRIWARRPLEAADGPGRRLRHAGLWSLTSTSPRPVSEQRYLSWSEQERLTGSATGGPAHQVADLPVAPMVLTCLRGVPAAMQEAVLTAIDFTQCDWSDAKAWGHRACGSVGRHAEPCETVVLAATAGSQLVVLRATRRSDLRKGTATRAVLSRQGSAVTRSRP